MELSVAREITVSKSVTRALGMGAVVLLTALGAYVRIPLPGTPVPLTLQTLFVILGAAFLGGSRGVLAQAAYIGLGVAGVPLFANGGSGLLYLAGPTAGYLAGFVIASLVIGTLIRHVDTKGGSVFMLLAASSIFILLCGALWLSLLSGSNRLVAQEAILPFIAGDMVKSGAVMLFYMKAKQRCRQLFD